MTDPLQQTLMEASKTLSGLILKVEKTTVQFADGTSQHSLQINRLHALRVSLALIESAKAEHQQDFLYGEEELRRSKAPIASLISKSEKAQLKLAPGSWQYVMLQQNLTALRLVYPMILKALEPFDSKTGS